MIGTIQSKLRQLQLKVSDYWRTSMLARVIVSISVVSGIVMLLLGVALASIFSQRLVDTKQEVALTEIDRARAVVEQQVNATGTSSSLQGRLNSARAALTQVSSQSAEISSVYEPVLLVAQPDGEVVTSPEDYRIPESLRRFVDEGQIASQFSEAERTDGTRYNSLIVGTPTNSDVPGLQLYLVMSLEQEESTLALMRGLLTLAAGVVVVLLVAVVWLSVQQVVGRVVSASRIAQRLAAGHLKERMVVTGEDEMATLALSFNDMADKLSHQIQQLEEYGDLQRQFTSDVSHELRTPLTTVRMAADLIAQDSDSFEPSTKRATELMLRELDRFEDLLADLLEISRHDAGVADLEIAPVDIGQCIDAAWSATSHISEYVGAEVTFKIPDDPVVITGDSRRVERILRNLIANALDHSEGNPVEVEVGTNESSVAIIVTDHGVGLKPGQEDLVFNRFWRADASRKRHSGGTGLGLAIAKEDAYLHGGILDAQGKEGVGSQFRLVLPHAPGEPINQPALELSIEDDEDESHASVAVEEVESEPKLVGGYGVTEPESEREEGEK